MNLLNSGIKILIGLIFPLAVIYTLNITPTIATWIMYTAIAIIIISAEIYSSSRTP